MPFLKHMDLSTLDQIILRLQALDVAPHISLCGTGDCSTHPDLVEIVRRLTVIFPELSITTNGYRINEKRATDLLDAGLKVIHFSISELGDAYEKTYGLPFDHVVENILRFRDIAGNRCKVFISPISRKRLDLKVKAVKEFWEEKGFHDFLIMQFTNRAGSLDESYLCKSDDIGFSEIFVEDKSLGLCTVPFLYSLIGPDGNYYLCSHDFKKQRSFGNVFTHSVADSLLLKKHYFEHDRMACLGCSANPLSTFARKNTETTIASYKEHVLSLIHISEPTRPY